ncbi:TAXI family TRAP transporter solute-binding subunit [Candidatus Palauibacter soopunensis]|uniref:TAXI family TRAP transporter solute-binding subunit n=1 Tax=Candidatus Palauibacter soopunensis TaxID=3056739 RepID=UPI002395FA02|nr:TAXI family TRAP transporter solute-binding subunit [Candidatus Palauibacter soopunensis]MDE2878093.1 TAXI family TRAP transporter solute-binding subunit [Candidatus Palauibacter soopunensis]
MPEGAFNRAVRPALICIAAAASAVGCGGEGQRTLSIATGNTNGLYYPLGGGLASIWSRHVDGVNMKAETTAGSVTNLIQVAKGESEVGFTQADALAAALAGRGRFPEPMPLASLGKLYPNVVHLVTIRSTGIESVQDLRGRRVSVGPPGSGNAVTAWNVLEAMGIGESDFTVRQLNYAQMSNGLKDGTLDAGFIAGGLGMPAVVEIGVSRDMVLVPFSEDEIATIIRSEPAYSGFRVPPGVYRGVDQPVLTPTLWNLIVVHRAMEAGLAYDLTRTMLERREDLENISGVASFITPPSARDVGDFPLHAGARRYFDEVLEPAER